MVEILVVVYIFTFNKYSYNVLDYTHICCINTLLTNYTKKLKVDKRRFTILFQQIELKKQ